MIKNCDNTPTSAGKNGSSKQKTSARGRKERTNRNLKSYWPDERTRRLISAVEQRPDLYNTKSLIYRAQKNQVWKEVASELGNRDDWNDCRIKWQRLRIAFRANLAKKSEYMKVHWRFFQAMQFLDVKKNLSLLSFALPNSDQCLTIAATNEVEALTNNSNFKTMTDSGTDISLKQKTSPKEKRKRTKKQVKGDWPDERIRRLISAVEKRPDLYNIESLTYRTPKDPVWKEVASELGNRDDWEDCRTKWQRLRISFNRNLAKKRRRVKVHWRFFQIMYFINLKTRQEKTKSTSNLVDNLDEKLGKPDEVFHENSSLLSSALPNFDQCRTIAPPSDVDALTNNSHFKIMTDSGTHGSSKEEISPTENNKRTSKHVKGDWPDKRTRRLISAVEKRPDLYSIGTLTCRTPKDQIWKEVASELGNRDDWEDCRIKWQRLRNAFRANLAKKKKGFEVYWRFFRAMHFLNVKKSQQKTKSTSNLVHNLNEKPSKPNEGVHENSSLLSSAVHSSDPCRTISAHSEVDALTNNSHYKIMTESATQLRNIRGTHSIFGDYVADELRLLPPDEASQLRRRINRTIMEFLDERESRCGQFWEKDVVENDEQFFKEHFRMSPEAFEILLRELKHLEKADTNFRKSIPLHKKIAIALYTLGSSEEYEHIGKRFGVEESVVCEVFKSFCTETWNVLQPKYFNKCCFKQDPIIENVENVENQYSRSIETNVVKNECTLPVDETRLHLTFGLLSARFRRVEKELDNFIDNTTLTIQVCCLLHNFLNEHKDNINSNWMLQQEENQNRQYPEYISKINSISQYLGFLMVPEVSEEDSTSEIVGAG